MQIVNMKCVHLKYTLTMECIKHYLVVSEGSFSTFHHLNILQRQYCWQYCNQCTLYCIRMLFSVATYLCTVVFTISVSGWRSPIISDSWVYVVSLSVPVEWEYWVKAEGYVSMRIPCVCVCMCACMRQGGRERENEKACMYVYVSLSEKKESRC